MARKRSKPVPRKETHRVGRRIRVREVRVIDADGTQLGIIPTHEALARAEEQDLELVEVNPKTSPPVCKILDYGKFKYEASKRDREAKRNKKTQELKEIKLRPKTHDHDFDFKVKHARRFLEEGNKVRLLIQFRGREITHPETGRAVLDRVCKSVADVAAVIQMASMEGNRMSMILGPKTTRGGSSGKSGGSQRTQSESRSSDSAPSPAAARDQQPANKSENSDSAFANKLGQATKAAAPAAQAPTGSTGEG